MKLNTDDLNLLKSLLQGAIEDTEGTQKQIYQSLLDVVQKEIDFQAAAPSDF